MRIGGCDRHGLRGRKLLERSISSVAVSRAVPIKLLSDLGARLCPDLLEYLIPYHAHLSHPAVAGSALFVLDLSFDAEAFVLLSSLSVHLSYSLSFCPEVLVSLDSGVVLCATYIDSAPSSCSGTLTL